MIASATLTDLHRAFLANWPDDHRLVLVTGSADLKTTSPKAPVSQIQDAFLAATGVVVKPYQASVAATFPYLAEPANAGSIVSKSVIEDLGITRIRFANGVQLNLKPTDYKTNEVLAKLVFGHGKSQEPDHLPGLSLLAEATINESGLGTMDTEELARALAGTSTELDFNIAEGYFDYSAKSVSGEMALLFQLLHAHLTDPGFRDDALLLARERLHQRYRSYRRSVEGMLRIEGMRVLAGGDGRFGIPPFEELQNLTLDHIQQWITPLLANASLELSIVGDFDEAQVIELARRYLGSLPERRDPIQPQRTDIPHLPMGTTHHIAVDTQISKSLLIVAWPTTDFWDIRRTRRLSVLADVFSERLRERVREKLGASYSPFAFNQPSRAYTGYGTFQAHVNVAPDLIDTVLTEVKAIAADLAQNGVSDDERIRALDPILTAIREYRQTNAYWLNSVLAGSSRAAQQFEWARSFLEDYAAITSQELSTLAGTYLLDHQSAALIIEPTAGEQK
jgi:zinc protease